MPIIDQGSKFNTVITAVGTGDTDCYVVPANHTTVVKNLMLTNANASARTFTIKIFQKSPNTTTTILTSHSLATITSTNIFTTTIPLFLAAEDKIIISASHASSIVSTISVEEFYDPSR